MNVPVASEPARIYPFEITCSTEGCKSTFVWEGGTASQFFETFVATHFDGWLCLMERPLEITCPACNAKEFRSFPRHQLFREKLAGQPEWKRDLVLASWAAMTTINDTYLRESEMPIWLRALLRNEKTPSASNVHQTLQKLEHTFWTHRDEANAGEACRLARIALGR